MTSFDAESTSDTLTTNLGSFRQKPIEPDEDHSENVEVGAEENVVSLPSLCWSFRDTS
jgi:hypothetical protein